MTVSDGSWTVTMEDMEDLLAHSSNMPDYGMVSSFYGLSPLIHLTGGIPWLFQPNFCDFQYYHLGFMVDYQYRVSNNVSLSKCIVRTTCPDPFSSDAGVAPPGHVCVTVMGQNRGSGIQHHIIPAMCLKPVIPTTKNQMCVIIKGPHLGELLIIKKCQKSSRKITANDGTEMSFNDVCLAFQLMLV